MALIYADKIKENTSTFLTKVEEISRLLGIKPDWLMQVMKQESSLNHRAVNSLSGATGLIQFMPRTAISLGTTTQALLSMTNVQQLDYVYKYLLPYKSKYKSFVDVYLTVFFPAAIGKPDNTVLQAKNLSAGTVARFNQGYDLNKDMQLTVGEIKAAILKKIPADFVNRFTEKKN